MNRKGNLKTKLAAVFSAGVLAVTGTASAVSGMTVSAQPSAGTYGDALKLSLYFFDANQCGADDNVLTWRGKCHTYDAEASLSSAKGLSSSSMAAIKAANGRCVRRLSRCRRPFEVLEHNGIFLHQSGMVLF